MAIFLARLNHCASIVFIDQESLLVLQCGPFEKTSKVAQKVAQLYFDENSDQTSLSPFRETWPRLRLCARSVALKIAPSPPRQTFSQLA